MDELMILHTKARLMRVKHAAEPELSMPNWDHVPLRAAAGELPAKLGPKPGWFGGLAGRLGGVIKAAPRRSMAAGLLGLGGLGYGGYRALSGCKAAPSPSLPEGDSDIDMSEYAAPNNGSLRNKIKNLTTRLAATGAGRAITGFHNNFYASKQGADEDASAAALRDLGSRSAGGGLALGAIGASWIPTLAGNRQVPVGTAPPNWAAHATALGNEAMKGRPELGDLRIHLHSVQGPAYVPSTHQVLLNQRPGLGTLAHELGHARQRYMHLPGVARGLSWSGPLASGGGMLAALESKDEDFARTGALIGSAATLPQLASEIDASARGSAMLHRLRTTGFPGVNRLGSWRGLPTYAAATAAPLLAYAGKRWAGGYDKEKPS